MAKAKEAIEAAPESYTVGRCYLVMTATHYAIGRIVSINPTELVLNEASWIPDTGRLHECLANGTVSECEPSEGELIIPRHAVMLSWRWNHTPPRSAK